MADRIVDPATGVSIREMAGRSGADTPTTDTMSRSFLCKGNADPMVCRTALFNQQVPLELFVFEGMNLENLSWKLKSGPDNWEFTASYSWSPNPGEFTIKMDSTGGTTKQTDADSQQKYNAAGHTARDFGTTVNVQDGKPEGVDRVIPALKLNINARISSQWVADPIGYAKTVASVTGSVNSGTYLGFESGELLFLGATGEIVGENPLLTYTFAASKNLANVTIGPVSGITKNGHDFIWFDYLAEKDNTTNLQVAKARGAYVAKVYEYADFGVLKIGEP